MEDISKPQIEIVDFHEMLYRGRSFRNLSFRKLSLSPPFYEYPHFSLIPSFNRFFEFLLPTMRKVKIKKVTPYMNQIEEKKWLLGRGLLFPGQVVILFQAKLKPKREA
jgi:hypothetical protein